MKKQGIGNKLQEGAIDKEAVAGNKTVPKVFLQKPSTSVVLKNLPPTTNEEDVSKLFS
eukprot:EC822888.1.p1 GENE.EC822888.1~~EC822888.1.p1  ORF type:complete len:58 (+),score=28.17 EC822888.1:36-209(+)